MRPCDLRWRRKISFFLFFSIVQREIFEWDCLDDNSRRSGAKVAEKSEREFEMQVRRRERKRERETKEKCKA